MTIQIVQADNSNHIIITYMIFTAASNELPVNIQIFG